MARWVDMKVVQRADGGFDLTCVHWTLPMTDEHTAYRVREAFDMAFQAGRLEIQNAIKNALELR